MGFDHLIFRSEHMASEALSVSLVRLKECNELFPRTGYCHTLQTSGMEMVEVLYGTNVMVKQEMKTEVKKSEIKCRNSGSVKQSYFGMLYVNRVMWKSELSVPPTAVQ